MKAGMAQMAKGGIVMDVVNVEQARIAEEAGVSYSDRLVFCVHPYISEIEYSVLYIRKNMRLIFLYLFYHL